MKYLKYFESNKFKVGDYVYPKPEYCGTFKVLKPNKYKIIEVHNSFVPGRSCFMAAYRFTNRREQFIEVDQIDTLKYDNTFPADYFMSEIEYELKKYNL